MELQEKTIEELNELSMQYSRWFITYEDFKTKRHELLNKLTSTDDETEEERSVIQGVVNTFSDLIKRN